MKWKSFDFPQKISTISEIYTRKKIQKIPNFLDEKYFWEKRTLLPTSWHKKTCLKGRPCLRLILHPTEALGQAWRAHSLPKSKALWWWPSLTKGSCANHWPWEEPPKPRVFTWCKAPHAPYTSFSIKWDPYAIDWHPNATLTCKTPALHPWAKILQNKVSFSQGLGRMQTKVG